MEFDLKDDEENEEEDEIINNTSITTGSTKTRLQSSSYREKAGHIAASS